MAALKSDMSTARSFKSQDSCSAQCRFYERKCLYFLEAYTMSPERHILDMTSR
jgi:hypothetical protein